MIIRRESIKAVLPATEARKPGQPYYLDQVEVQPDGRVVATDGCLLLIATDKYPYKDTDFPVKDVAPYTSNPEQPITISRTAVEKLIGAMPKRSPIPILSTIQVSTNGDGYVASATDLEVPCVVHLPASEQGNENRYPQWRRVVPAADKPKLCVSLAVPILEDLIKAAKAAQGDRKRAIVIRFELPTEPQHQRKGADGQPSGDIQDAITVTIKGEDVDVFGVVMPCREP